MLTDSPQAIGLARIPRVQVVRPGCTHADVTHSLLEAVNLPYEQLHEKAGTRRGCAQAVSLTITSARLRMFL